MFNLTAPGRTRVRLAFAVCGLALNACSDEPETKQSPAVNKQARGHSLSAGEATVFVATASAFEKPSANLRAAEKIRDFNIGNDFFKNPWVPSRSSTSMRDGLGPLFNNNACQDCHIRDGRGHAPHLSETEDGTDFSSMLIRTAKARISDGQKHLMLASQMANVGDGTAGGQLQQQALPGIKKEAALRVSYDTLEVNFADGHSIELVKPSWHLTNLYKNNGYDFDEDTVFSARVAPPMIGLGLLQLIPEQLILANQDMADDNHDGISGKANYVWSIEKNAVALGRFGWKAGQPSIKEQAAGAFLGDMGLTSALHPNENCLPHQKDCQSAPNGNGDSTGDYDYEVSDKVLEKVTFYSAHLAVPARRNTDSHKVLKGHELFRQAGCNSCHIEKWQTGDSDSLPELAHQTIYPFTDLLLHDMGKDLADFTIDNQAVTDNTLYEYLATTTEWRTPPLWGIGLSKTVSQKATFLHDGRARTIMEAVLWHGGEAQSSKETVLKFDKSQREQLLAFLNSL